MRTKVENRPELPEGYEKTKILAGLSEKQDVIYADFLEEHNKRSYAEIFDLGFDQGVLAERARVRKVNDNA